MRGRAWTGPEREKHRAYMREVWKVRRESGWRSPCWNGGRPAARLRALGVSPEKILCELRKTYCEACGRAFGDARKRWIGDFRAWDHDHKSGRYRGAICQTCNLCLGAAKESVERLLGLARYLRRKGKL